MRLRPVAALAGLLLTAAVAAPLAPSATAAPAPRMDDNGNRPKWCTANDPLPMDDMTEQQMMDEMMFYPDMKGPIPDNDCRRLVRSMRQARAWALTMPTAADAEAHGFRMIVPYVHGMGAHYIGPAGITNTIDPTRPNFLLYGGNSPEAPLVGLMWIVNSGGAPPQYGLPGGNDHWHRHDKLCMVNGLIVAEGLTNAECRARGGNNLDVSNLWMLHAWVVPGWQYEADIFRPHHPMLMDVPPDQMMAPAR